MYDSFSDSDGEKAVEELLSQAMDSAVLEQVASINCAGFTDAGLPSHLETRFQRLKSLPSSAVPRPPVSLSLKSSKLSSPAEHEKPSEPKDHGPTEEKKTPESRSTFSPEEKSSPADADGSPFSPLGGNRTKMEKKGRRKSASSSFSSSSSRSISPPAKTGCFPCSPIKVPSRKKNKENRDLELELDWGKRDDKLLSDLSNFSVKSQRKMMKKAMEEEERVCREAEKIVTWAKQASARMDVSGLEDEPSDDENAKFH